MYILIFKYSTRGLEEKLCRQIMDKYEKLRKEGIENGSKSDY